MTVAISDYLMRASMRVPAEQEFTPRKRFVEGRFFRRIDDGVADVIATLGLLHLPAETVLILGQSEDAEGLPPMLTGEMDAGACLNWWQLFSCLTNTDEDFMSGLPGGSTLASRVSVPGANRLVWARISWEGGHELLSERPSGVADRNVLFTALAVRH